VTDCDARLFQKVFDCLVGHMLFAERADVILEGIKNVSLAVLFRVVSFDKLGETLLRFFDVIWLFHLVRNS